MHVLLIGSGGREHALAWKIAQSQLLTRLSCAPGNLGTASVGTNVEIDADDMPAWAERENVDLVVVGPEAPLDKGLADALEARGIPCFGPSAAGARIESSKAFMKGLCDQAGIPTAAYDVFDEPGAAKAYLKTQTSGHVVKADGLAGGKGVVVTRSLDVAEAAVDDAFAGAFGEAGKTLVIEERLEGTEISVFALTDGETLLSFGAAQDHKGAHSGPDAPNTGGMGGFSPSPIEDEALMARIDEEILRPTLAALMAQGITYRGVLFAGLMVTAQGPKLIEFNCRFGDPEAQILVRRVRSDILPALWGAATGRLAGVGLDWKANAVANIIYATQGYPGDHSKARGTTIAGVDKAEEMDGVIVFHAGTALADGALIAAGGRVLNITAEAPTLVEALNRAYDAVAKIKWDQGYFRHDIGLSLRQ